MVRAQRKVEDAEMKVARAERALTAFNVEAETRLQSGQLGLKRSEISVQESVEELAELEQMYELDEFADTTKNLVVGRNRRQLELARERLEISRKEFAHLEVHELAEEQRSLAEKIETAEFELVQAQRDLESARLGVESSLDEARWKLKKAQEAADESGDA